MSSNKIDPCMLFQSSKDYDKQKHSLLKVKIFTETILFCEGVPLIPHILKQLYNIGWP